MTTVITGFLFELDCDIVTGTNPRFNFSYECLVIGRNIKSNGIWDYGFLAKKLKNKRFYDWNMTVLYVYILYKKKLINYYLINI